MRVILNWVLNKLVVWMYRGLQRLRTESSNGLFKTWYWTYEVKWRDAILSTADKLLNFEDLSH